MNRSNRPTMSHEEWVQKSKQDRVPQRAIQIHQEPVEDEVLYVSPPIQPAAPGYNVRPVEPMSVEHAIQLKNETAIIGGTKPTNPKDRAATSRLDISLFPQSAIAYGALGMTEGDCKYGGYNYRVAGVSVSTYVAAANRHLMKFYNGEWADQLTKVPHLASALSCIGIMIDSFVQGNIVDDRPPKQDMAKVLAEFEGIVKHLQALYPNGPERNTELSHDNAVNR